MPRGGLRGCRSRRIPVESAAPIFAKPDATHECHACCGCPSGNRFAGRRASENSSRGHAWQRESGRPYRYRIHRAQPDSRGFAWCYRQSPRGSAPSTEFCCRGTARTLKNVGVVTSTSGSMHHAGAFVGGAVGIPRVPRPRVVISEGAHASSPPSVRARGSHVTLPASRQAWPSRALESPGG